MKKVLYVISVVLSIVYVFAFCFNVSDLAKQHMDLEIFYPLDVMAFSGLLFLIMLIINKLKAIDKKLFFIPLLFFVCSIITLIIGCNTFCPYCSL